ncbi:MAG: hypothetical protein LBH25_05970, partial [Fibromonadaceae bacterium]|nr:hypothetical protein [Fibromonadaceae bacterium]
EKGTRSIQPSDNNLNLTVAISKDYLEIWARGGSLPKIFYKECNDGKKMNLCVLHKESEEDPGIIKMSVYSKSDSAYLSENVFITDINAVKPGATVATLSESSSRKLACGQSAAGVEDICSDGKSAVTLRPRSAYDELALALIMIHNRFIDSPDADKINIITDDDMAISKVLQVHHEAKTAGFFKANFPKLVGATNKTAQENGTFTDPRDKKAYKTVKIGELVWMAENLNYSAKGSKCYDNKPANCTKYGRLYNWDEAMKACPSGWHLPSNEDWDKLYYCSKDKSGGTLHHWCSGPYISKAAGKYLKAKSGWNRNGNGEDKFGFSALPGGEGYPYGSVGNDGNWWSSSNDFGTGAHFRTISYGEDASCSFEYNCKDMDSDESVGDGEGKLFSVRCVEDSEAYVRAKAEVEAKAKAEAEQVVEKAKQDSIAKQARQNSVRGKK